MVLYQVCSNHDDSMILADSVNHLCFLWGFSLNDFFSATTHPIELKFSLNVPWVVLYQVCSIHGNTLILANSMNHLSFSEGFSLNDFFSETVCPFQLKFSLNVPLLVPYQVCSNHDDSLILADSVSH